MVIEILLGAAVLIFALIAFFLIRTLIALGALLKTTQSVLLEMRIKTSSIDALLRSLSQMGDICEAESNKLHQSYFKAKQENFTEVTEQTCDWVDWLQLSLKLGSKFIKRR